MKYDAIMLLKTTHYDTSLSYEFNKREDDDKKYPPTQISSLISRETIN
jgi:hypothetical protein